jgi:4-hydroxy-3-methylbut-2-enyl diphosphate reductase
MSEAEEVCGLIEGTGDAAHLSQRFSHAVSEGFDFKQDLERVGVANQTTMLARESLAIADRVKTAFARRYGESAVNEHFRSFDTICSATQERQDAILELLEEPLDLMIVIGGYNSSNTMSLAKICAQRVATLHVEDATGIDPETGAIHHQPVGSKEEVRAHDWLPDTARVVGITAGASTPNNKIGEAIVRILKTRGLDLPAGVP